MPTCSRRYSHVSAASPPATDADCDSVLSVDDINDEDPTSDSDADGQGDLDEYICGSDPFDFSSVYDTTDSDENTIADCLE